MIFNWKPTDKQIWPNQATMEILKVPIWLLTGRKAEAVRLDNNFAEILSGESAGNRMLSFMDLPDFAESCGSFNREEQPNGAASHDAEIEHLRAEAAQALPAVRRFLRVFIDQRVDTDLFIYIGFTKWIIVKLYIVQMIYQ